MLIAIQLIAHASASAQSIYLLFIKNNCYCSTSRSLLPDAYIDILHNSQGLAVPPTCGDTTWVITADPYRRVRALRVLSLMCMCSCFHMGSYSHCTHEASRKSVYHPSLATRGQFGSGIRSHHDHHSEEFSLVAPFHCVQPLLKALFYSIYGHQLPLWALSVL